MSSHGSRFFADFTSRPSRGIILAGGTAMYRILIVEDDPVITETLCAYMGRWGMEARGVEDFQNVDRKSTRLNSSHNRESRMPSSA